MREVRLRAERRAERRRARHPFADEERRHLVEVDAAVGFRHVHAEQPELAASLEEPARDGPVVLFEAVERRQHLLIDELLRGAANQPVLVREPFGRQDLARVGRLDRATPRRRS